MSMITWLYYTIVFAKKQVSGGFFIEKFCGLVTPIYDRISMNIIESQKLTALRDSLLPKLMSGEVDVSVVEV